MRKFTHTVAKIKNSSGEYESIPALRGQSPYELAVECGFEGTEKEWMELMIGDGWVSKFQELEAKKANKTDVYTIEQVDGLVKGITAKYIPVSDEVASITGHDNTDDAVNYAASAAVLSSYLALVGNVNVDMVNAALGKNNEEYVVGVGKALAMYAAFKDSSVVVNDFPNLKVYNRLTELSDEAITEIINNTTLNSLVGSNKYMYTKTLLDKAKNVIYDYTLPYDVPEDSSWGVSPVNFMHNHYSVETRNYKTWIDVIARSNSSVDDTGYSLIKGVEQFPTNGANFLNICLVDVNSCEFGIVDDAGTVLSRSTPVNGGGWYSINVSDLDTVTLGFVFSEFESGTHLTDIKSIILSNYEIK